MLGRGGRVNYRLVVVMVMLLCWWWLGCDDTQDALNDALCYNYNNYFHIVQGCTGGSRHQPQLIFIAL